MKQHKISLLNIIISAILLVYSISVLLPLLWGLLASIKSVDEFRLNILGIPQDWAFGNFPFVIKYFAVPANVRGFMRTVGLAEMIYNTILYVTGSALLSAAVPCLTAYLCSKFPCFLSRFVYGTVIITMILPIVGAYPSELQVLRNLGLYDTFYGMWVQRANFLGMYFLIFFAAFKGIPKEFSEAAYVDGASEMSLMLRIQFVLVRNTFFTVFLIRFIEFWNDYQAPLLYMPGHPTLSYGLYYLSYSTINGLNNIPMRMAGTILVIVPILSLFIAFKERIMGNMTMGGIKG